MHPIDRYLKDCNLTRYQFSQRSGISEQRLSNIVNRQTKIKNIKMGVIDALHVVTGKSTDLIMDKLKSYEEKNEEI